MVVKDDVGRRRYILFDVPAERPTRDRFTQAIGQRSWRLTVYTADRGILRVPHTEVDEARAFLEEMGATPRTTSGTIKGAKRAGGLLG